MTTISTDEFRKLVSRGKRVSKYGAKKAPYNGATYDSKAEAERAKELDYLLQIGQIRGWTRQVTFHLGCSENVYRADFLVFECNGGVHAEDVKGARTPKFNRDVKLWKRYGPCVLVILRKSGKGWKREHCGGA